MPDLKLNFSNLWIERMRYIKIEKGSFRKLIVSSRDPFLPKSKDEQE
jgi:hypothetical protein